MGLRLLTLKYVNNLTAFYNALKGQPGKCHELIFASTFNFPCMNGIKERQLFIKTS